MPAPNNNQDRPLARQEEVASLYLMGLSQAKIAERLGVNQSTISRDLQSMRQKWLESTLRDFDEAKSQEIAKIDQTEFEAWEAWARSQKDSHTVKEKLSEKDGFESQTITSEQVGDPRFLDIVNKCIAKRCEILGLDAPKTVNNNITGSFMTREQMKAEILKRVKGE